MTTILGLYYKEIRLAFWGRWVARLGENLFDLFSFFVLIFFSVSNMHIQNRRFKEYKMGGQ
jgi:hypothetical protein